MTTANASQRIAASEIGARAVSIEDTKSGEYIKLAATETSKVYKRGRYVHAIKSYSVVDCEDINRERFIKRGRIVFVGFTY